MTNRLFRRSLIALFLSAVLLIWIGHFTDLDLILADWMYDHRLHRFPWRDEWFAAVFMHNWMKWFFIASSIGLITALVADFLFQLDWFSGTTRRKLAAVASASIAVPLSVIFLKSWSVLHCPWDVQRYHGFAPFLRLLDPVPDGITAGHCFPAGHASAGLWIAAIAVFWLPERPKKAGAAFAVGLLPGLTMGWVQQLRGAHFLSHTLWSIWIAALVVVLVSRLFAPAHALCVESGS